MTSDPTERTQRLVDAVMTVFGDLDLAQVLLRLVEVAVELVGAPYGAVGVLDVQRQGLAEFITVGIDDATVAAIGAPPVGRGILGHLITHPEPLRLDDLSASSERSGFPAGHPPMAAFLGVPVRAGGEVFGNLYLCDDTPGRRFSVDDQAVVTQLANAAGVAVAHAQASAQRAALQVAHERERIARDLHDSVIQRLFALGVRWEGLSRRVSDPELAGRISDSIDQLDVTVREIRAAIFAIQALELGRESARQVVRTVVQDARRMLAADVVLRMDGPVDTVVDEELLDDLAAVTREALANVARHAAASHVLVELLVTGDRVVLTVTDDGVGHGSGSGRGQSNLRTRAQRRGGHATWSAGEQATGTVLTWSVPIPGSPASSG